MFIILLSLSVPFAIQHKALKSTTFRGYNIPADNTNIMANIYGAHMDPRVFPNPEQFRPSRYFNDQGEFVKSDAVIPFSMGKAPIIIICVTVERALYLYTDLCKVQYLVDLCPLV